MKKSFRVLPERLNIHDLYPENGEYDLLIRHLNENYLGWILLKNKYGNDYTLFYITEYRFKYHTSFRYEFYSKKKVKMQDIFEADIEMIADIDEITSEDIIIKVEEIDYKPAKIRWYSKGRFSDWKEYE